MKHLYCAHIISTYFYRNRIPKQREWVVEEAYVAVIAKNDAVAHLESNRIGNESYSLDDPSLILNKIPVRKQFLGVRKIIRADTTETQFISTN